MSGLTRANDPERAGLLAVTLLAAALLLTGLGSPLLWQDEAQTALIAGTVLDRGIPYGTDGRNFFSQEQGAEYGENHLWRWHTWLPFYLVAASHALLGAGTAATRLPFALFGIATVLLSFATARRLWPDGRAAWPAAIGLALCVPFLLLSRQGRWYAAASFFSLLGLHAYLRLGDRRGAPRTTLFAAATLLFHSHYLYCATLLATLLVHAALFERGKFRDVLTSAALVTLVNAPWVAWLATISLDESYSGRLLDWSRSMRLARRFASQFFRDFLPPLLLLAPLVVVADRLRCREPAPFRCDPRTAKSAALLAIFCATNILALGLLAPGGYFRYLAPLAPPALLAIGALVTALYARAQWLGAAVAIAWLATGSLDDFAYELTHDFDGPIEGIVTHLERHARPGDTVAITYGDLPLKFYTDLRVIGGLTGEDLTEASVAEWVIPRRSVGSREERRVQQQLAGLLSPERYRRVVIDYPDTQFENRENPAMHRYRTERPTFPRVVIYERRR